MDFFACTFSLQNEFGLELSVLLDQSEIAQRVFLSYRSALPERNLCLSPYSPPDLQVVMSELNSLAASKIPRISQLASSGQQMLKTVLDSNIVHVQMWSTPLFGHTQCIQLGA